MDKQVRPERKPQTTQKLYGAAGGADKRKSSARGRLLGRLTANLQHVREPQLRARLVASIEQLAQETREQDLTVTLLIYQALKLVRWRATDGKLSLAPSAALHLW
jgi:hypothetical protein